MPSVNRDLTMSDISRVISLSAEGDAKQVYRAVEDIAKETCGWRLFTILKRVEAEAAVERVHSSDEKAYPVGGQKPLGKLTVNQKILEQGQVFLAADRQAVKDTYFDYELIFSLGVTAILNAPIRHAGKLFGSVNFSGEEGMYGPAEKERAKVLAGLLVPQLLSELLPH